MLLLCTIFMCSSCYHVYYAPNTANPPLLTEKGELRINGLVSSGMQSEFTDGELQVAYAPQKSWGLMLNTFAGAKSENTGDAIEKGSGSYVELGSGLFMPFSENRKWVAEMYAGIGTGSVRNEYAGRDYSRVGVSKLFLQPSVGFKGRTVEIAVVPKISHITLNVKQSSFSAPDNDYEKQDLEYIRQKPSFFAFEPALIFRGGGENFKIHLGLSFSNISPFFYTQIHETCTASIGASLNLRTKK